MYTDVMVIHPFLRGADLDGYAFELGKRDSSLPTKGRPTLQHFDNLFNRFIPSYEGQTLSVYAAFSRLKHLVVQFTQMPFLSHPRI